MIISLLLNLSLLRCSDINESSCEEPNPITESINDKIKILDKTIKIREEFHKIQKKLVKNVNMSHEFLFGSKSLEEHDEKIYNKITPLEKFLSSNIKELELKKIKFDKANNKKHKLCEFKNSESDKYESDESELKNHGNSDTGSETMDEIETC